MIRSDMRQKVRDQGFADTAEFSDASINLLINQVNREVEGSHPDWPHSRASLPTTVVLAAGVSSITLAANVNKVRAVFAPDGASLTYLPLDDFLSVRSQGATVGDNPAVYTISGTVINTAQKRLMLYPLTDSDSAGAYEIWYSEEIEDLASDSDVPRFSASHHWVIVNGVIAKLQAQVFGEDDPKAVQAKANYEKSLAAMKADLLADELDKADSVGVRGTAANLMQVLRDMGFSGLGNRRLMDVLNDAASMIVSKFDFQFSQTGPVNVTLAANASTVTLPAGFAKVQSLVDPAQNWELVPVSAATLIDRESSSANNIRGVPEIYSVWGSALGVPQLRVWPIPSSATTLKLWYSRIPGTVDSRTDTFDWPVHHLRPLILGAAIIATDYVDKDMSAKKRSWQEEFEHSVSLMQMDLSEPHLNNPYFIEPSAEDRY